jgi:hypothetical protein
MRGAGRAVSQGRANALGAGQVQSGILLFGEQLT